MIAYTAWDFLLSNLKGDTITLKAPTKSQADSLLFLISSGFMTRRGKIYTLTEKGKNRTELMSKHRTLMRKGIPLSKRVTTLPEWFLLMRDNKVTKWYKGTVREKNIRFMTDRGGMFGGDTLLSKKLVKKDLYLHYFPASPEMLKAAVELTNKVYKIKPKMVLPFFYQRYLFSSPGIVWFKDLDKKLYSMSCVYYDYLTTWSGRAKFDPKFGVVVVDDEILFTVECNSAPGRAKLIGDLTAIIGQVITSKEPSNAEVS